MQGIGILLFSRKNFFDSDFGSFGNIFIYYGAIANWWLLLVSTTIQIEAPTKELLDGFKRNFHSKTYDDVINALVRKKTKSMYGFLAGKKKISVNEMMKGLRDKRD